MCEADEAEDASEHWRHGVPWEVILAAEPEDVLDLLFGEEFTPFNNEN